MDKHDYEKEIRVETDIRFKHSNVTFGDLLEGAWFSHQNSIYRKTRSDSGFRIAEVNAMRMRDAFLTYFRTDSVVIPVRPVNGELVFELIEG